MRPLGILHVTPYSPDTWAYGGIPRVAGTLTRGLARRGHRVTICTTDAGTAATRLGRPADAAGLVPWPASRTHDDVEVRVFPNVSNRLAYDWQLFAPVGLGAYLSRHAREFDIAHLHACRNLPGVVAARHLRRAGVPFVLAPNGTAPRLERRILAKRVFDATVGRGATADAACVLAVSEAERRQLLALGVPPDAIRRLPNPVDLDEFDPPIARGRFRARAGLGEAPVVLFLGKMTPRKRLDVLVRAFASLDRPSARLVIAGNDMGAGRAARDLVRALGLDTRALFTGLVAGRDRLEALADADVVVYPSEHEIFGLVPLEALLSGSPVVVADDSGCGEVTASTGGGLVVPLGDAAALASAIRQVLDDPDRWRARAAEAAAIVRRTYGGDVVAAELAELYLAVLAKDVSFSRP